MNEEVLKDVLEDVLEELKEANRSLTDMRTRLTALDGKVSGFEQKLNDQQVIVHPPDLTPVANSVTKQGEGLQSKMETQVSAFRTEMEQNIRRLAVTVEAQPKPIVRQWRLCLFPESDPSGSYKHFVNWLFGGTMLALLIGALYMLGSQYVERMHPAQADVSAAPSRFPGRGDPPPRSAKKEGMKTKKVRAARASDTATGASDTLSKKIIYPRTDDKRIPPDTTKMP